MPLQPSNAGPGRGEGFRSGDVAARDHPAVSPAVPVEQAPRRALVLAPGLGPGPVLNLAPVLAPKAVQVALGAGVPAGIGLPVWKAFPALLEARGGVVRVQPGALAL